MRFGVVEGPKGKYWGFCPKAPLKHAKHDKHEGEGGGGRWHPLGECLPLLSLARASRVTSSALQKTLEVLEHLGVFLFFGVCGKNN